jgi:hypothetical protein
MSWILDDFNSMLSSKNLMFATNPSVSFACDLVDFVIFDFLRIGNRGKKVQSQQGKNIE